MYTKILIHFLPDKMAAQSGYVSNSKGANSEQAIHLQLHCKDEWEYLYLFIFPYIYIRKLECLIHRKT